MVSASGYKFKKDGKTKGHKKLKLKAAVAVAMKRQALDVNGTAFLQGVKA